MEEPITNKEKGEYQKHKNTITTTIKEDFQLKIEIKKWENKTNKLTKKLEVIYNIELYSELSSKKWNVYHSIQDFKEFINNLSYIFPNLPDTSNLKSLEKEKSTSLIISKTTSALLDFINNISYRSDIINSKYYIEFFKLENHFGNLDKNEPKEKLHITGLKNEVSDMIFLDKKDILIVACGQINNLNVLSKINFWSKKEKNGQLNIYKINHNQEKENGFTLIGQTETESEISSICVPKENKFILVGYFNGTIDIFEFPEYIEKSNTIINLIPKNKIEININKNRIINIGYNSLENSFYCACYKEVMIYSAKIDSKNLEYSLPGSEDYLCGFYYEENYKNLKDLVIQIDISGKIYIGLINKEQKCIDLIYVLIQEINQITLFKVDLEYNHIYIGDKNGNIDIYSLEIFGNNDNDKSIINNQIKIKRILNICVNNDQKGKLTNMILRNFPYKINDICYNPKRKEIIIALDNSSIQIFSHFKNFPEYIIYNPNTKNKKENIMINKLYFSKLNFILYSGTSDKDIYIYQMPENYNSEISRRLQDSNTFEILNGNKFCQNAIEQGYPNSTQNFKKKTIINRMGIKTYV